MSVHYEWQIRHPASDFFEVADKLSKFTADGVRMLLKVEDGYPGELTLVRHGRGSMARFPYGREPRGDAEVNSKCALPTIFNNGTKVPKRFQAELTKWKAGGFR